jgi:hypothetical protein
MFMLFMFITGILALGHDTQHNDTRPTGLIAAQLISIMISCVSNSFGAMLGVGMLGAIVLNVDMLSDVVLHVIIRSM